MKKKMLGAVASALVIVFAVALAIPAFTLADSSRVSAFDEPTVQTSIQGDATVQSSADCTLTIKYYEAVFYEDPDVEVDDSNRVLLGEHVVTGLHEGDVISAWDYVVDIPGHMFFDGWPGSITISADPSQNIFELMYLKLWESEFTVNYYVMLGADLTADNWTDALAPAGVEFIKIGSETFENQRYDSLVVGDAYEYKLDGMYVIDTYPAQIRLDLNPDNNILNVLYTPDSVNLPDDMEIYDITTLPDDMEIYDITTLPDDQEVSDEPSSDGSGDVTLPDDEVLNKDDLIALLPDSVLVPTEGGSLEESDGDEINDDFIGNVPGEGELEITDEMLDNTVSKDDAEALKKAYETGLHQRGSLAQTGDFVKVMPFVLIAIAAAIICLILVRRGKKTE